MNQTCLCEAFSFLARIQLDSAPRSPELAELHCFALKSRVRPSTSPSGVGMSFGSRLGQFLTLTAAMASIAHAQSPNVPIAQEFERLHFRSIGPAIMSGRISDFAVYEANPAVFYVGTAHGGVWKTTSGGALMTPVLQDQGLLSIGDVTVSQSNPDLVWVGKGEANNRQSTSWGDGIYKSTDGGKTWTNMGLAESKHIGRIVIDPSNN